MNRCTIMQRRLVEVNTDPMRRCYDGVHAKSENVWTAWEILERGVPEDRLEFWRGLNDYAVKARGRVNTLCEFKAEIES